MDGHVDCGDCRYCLMERERKAMMMGVREKLGRIIIQKKYVVVEERSGGGG